MYISRFADASAAMASLTCSTSPLLEASAKSKWKLAGIICRPRSPSPGTSARCAAVRRSRPDRERRRQAYRCPPVNFDRDRLPSMTPSCRARAHPETLPALCRLDLGIRPSKRRFVEAPPRRGRRREATRGGRSPPAVSGPMLLAKPRLVRFGPCGLPSCGGRRGRRAPIASTRQTSAERWSRRYRSAGRKQRRRQGRLQSGSGRPSGRLEPSSSRYRWRTRESESSSPILASWTA